MKKNRTIYVTQEDAARLEALVAQHRSGRTTSDLEEEIARAKILSADRISPSVVTMNSRVKYRDKETGAVHEVTLVYPHEADFSRRKVSVLAPVGIALLGLSVGQTMHFQVPDGREKGIEILGVTYQPEAAAKAEFSEPVNDRSGVKA
jgi:regulator of nucleoside diphosphate kinase